jgi:hypothetical protein
MQRSMVTRRMAWRSADVLPVWLWRPATFLTNRARHRHQLDLRRLRRRFPLQAKRGKARRAPAVLGDDRFHEGVGAIGDLEQIVHVRGDL